jgi:hypothetical protein
MVTSTTAGYEDALALALKLSPQERLKLAAQVVSSVENELSAVQVEPAAEGAWGAGVIALLEQLDLTDWEHLDIADVGEWVRGRRREESERHAHTWIDDE